jgi:hypothetical protein
MKNLFTGLSAGIQLRYSGTIHDWLTEHVRIPHSARSTHFELTMASWLNAPLEAFANDRVKQICIAAPTGGAKTTFLELLIPYVIAQQPGPMMVAGQNDDMAKEWCESRLLPMLEACEPVRKLYPEDRHQKRKTAILFPHMPLFIVGANMSSLQEKSMRFCYGDETWQWKPGMIEEMKKRHHDRWNRKTILVSQGWDSGCEMGDHYEAGDISEFGAICPGCGQWHKMLWSSIKYEEKVLQNGEFDWAEIAKTVRHECPHCNYPTLDTTQGRRLLSSSGSYRSEGNPHISGNVSFKWTALSVWWITWTDLVFEWLKANDQKKVGNLVPLKQFKQKRLAQIWRHENDAPAVALSADDYLKADFVDGQKIEGESDRFMTIDRQKHHYWVCIRAWRPNGSSKLLWYGKVLTVESMRMLQLRMGVKDMRVFQDGQYDTPSVYDECSRFNWVALHGSGKPGFAHIPRNGKKLSITKFFSPLRKVQSASGGSVNSIHWAVTGVKDVLSRLRETGAPTWSFPKDICEDWLWQVNSEAKIDVVHPTTKAVKQEYRKFRDDNHAWDCEAMQVACAMIFGILPSASPDEDKG